MTDAITNHDRLLAREVIDSAYKLYVSGNGPDDLPECRDVVIRSRWPVRGRGGVAQANARTQRAVRAAINEFYSPSEIQEPNT